LRVLRPAAVAHMLMRYQQPKMTTMDVMLAMMHLYSRECQVPMLMYARTQDKTLRCCPPVLPGCRALRHLCLRRLLAQSCMSHRQQAQTLLARAVQLEMPMLSVLLMITVLLCSTSRSPCPPSHP
jgi:hypothetical protein